LDVPDEQVAQWRAEGKSWEQIGRDLGEQLNQKMDQEIRDFYAAIERYNELRPPAKGGDS
jgi:hypothetical protein